MGEKTSALPETIGSWTRPDAARIIDSSNIFKYMNGAGELYLAYGFDRLEVYEYTSDQHDSILVEVYFMKTSNDAFGLLSMDWGGEPVAIHAGNPSPSNPAVSPTVRALYGQGLLRIWADTVYARVMAYRETAESKQAVLSLGRKIGEGRKVPGEPALLKILPEAVESTWKLKKDRVAYLRSHLVLNSIYYLSHQNILRLDHSTEAVTATYESISGAGAGKKVQLLFVRYANTEHALEALSYFHSTYLHDHKKEFNKRTTDKRGNFFHIEDGWMGYLRDGRCLAVVFECPDRRTAESFLKHINTNAINKENTHGK
ncbi:DUF6599 family protein [Thermodesulfobacteriota bacterium]